MLLQLHLSGYGCLKSTKDAVVLYTFIDLIADSRVESHDRLEVERLDQVDGISVWAWYTGRTRDQQKLGGNCESAGNRFELTCSGCWQATRQR